MRRIIFLPNLGQVFAERVECLMNVEGDAAGESDSPGGAGAGPLGKTQMKQEPSEWRVYLRRSTLSSNIQAVASSLCSGLRNKALTPM